MTNLSLESPTWQVASTERDANTNIFRHRYNVDTDTNAGLQVFIYLEVVHLVTAIVLDDQAGYVERPGSPSSPLY